MKGGSWKNDRDVTIRIYAARIYHRNLTGRDRTIDRNHDRLKRMSMIGDALSHASPLAGVALGLLLGINPILGAMGICLFAALELKQSEERSQDILRWRYRSLCQQGSDLPVFYPDS